MTEYITSPGNELIKSVAALQQKKYRDQTNLFIAEGVHLVREALMSTWHIEICFYVQEVTGNKEVQDLLPLLSAAGCRLIKVTLPIYKKISDTEHGQGILVVVRKKQYLSSDLFLSMPSSRIFAILDGLQDPGNIGTIIRTADAAGCAGVILTDGSADVYSGKTIRSTMGSLFHLPIVEHMSHSEVIDCFKREGITMVATALQASQLYYKEDLSKNVAIIFGNEGQGVSQELLAAADKKLHIPMYGQAESLNVAISAAVILYEAARQSRSSL